MPAFFNVFNEAANIARESGVQDKLAGGRLSDNELSEVLRLNDHLNRWLASQQSSNGQPIQAIPVSKISVKKWSAVDVARAESLFTETDDVEIHLDGAPGAIGFLRFQKMQQCLPIVNLLFKPVEPILVAETKPGPYANAVSDFAGNLQNGGQITIGFAGDNVVLVCKGASYMRPMLTQEAGYRMGTATLVVETGGDSFGHYVGNGLCVVSGPSATTMIRGRLHPTGYF